MHFLGYVYAISAAITWGLVYTIDNRILFKASPLALLFVDAVFTILVSLPFFLYKKQEIMGMFSDRHNITLVVLSVILSIVANFFIYSAIKNLGASLASTFEISYPF